MKAKKDKEHDRNGVKTRAVDGEPRSALTDMPFLLPLGLKMLQNLPTCQYNRVFYSAIWFSDNCRIHQLFQRDLVHLIFPQLFEYMMPYIIEKQRLYLKKVLQTRLDYSNLNG